MNLLPRCGAATLALLLVASSSPGQNRSDRHRLERDLEATFEATGGGHQRLVVDNVHGSITVRSHAGPSVVMQAHETVLAKRPELLERARDEVRLEQTAENGEVVLYVDGPFRDRHDRNSWRGHEDPGYRVAYDFDILVPVGIELDLRTVNDGDIDVEDVGGPVTIRNVNGSIDVRGASGAAQVRTVNGPITIAFDQPASADSSVETINGDVIVSFPPPLDADFFLETMHGELWSAFEVSGIPTTAKLVRDDDGRHLYRARRDTAVRAGNGGPQIHLKTLNGDVEIRRLD